MSTSTANIGLTKPEAGDTVSLTTINANYDKIDTAIGALGTPTSSNNIMSIFGGEVYGKRASQGSSFAAALNASTFVPYTSASASAKTSTENAFEALETAIGSITGDTSGPIFTTATAGGGGTMYVGGMVAKHGGNSYCGVMFCTATNLVFFFRKTAASGNNAYTVKVL